MRTAARAASLVLVLGLLGCTGDKPATPAVPSHPPTPAAAAPAGCPVTMPTAVPSTQPWREGLFGAGSAHGNGDLWVGGLGADGVISAGPELVEPDGSVGMKFGWWRTVPGELRITGRRLDGPAPPLRADVPEGYGERGFQASGVYFPLPGCWEVTGMVGASALTFVTAVAKHP